MFGWTDYLSKYIHSDGSAKSTEFFQASKHFINVCKMALDFNQVEKVVELSHPKDIPMSLQWNDL
jgi:hypothetical protein